MFYNYTRFGNGANGMGGGYNPMMMGGQRFMPQTSISTPSLQYAQAKQDQSTNPTKLFEAMGKMNGQGAEKSIEANPLVSQNDLPPIDTNNITMGEVDKNLPWLQTQNPSFLQSMGSWGGLNNWLGGQFGAKGGLL